MTASKISISLASLLVEVTYLYPLYFLVLAGLSQPAASVWRFIALVAAAFVVNLLLGAQRLRLITVFLINGLLAALAACWFVYSSLSPAVPFWPFSWAACFVSAAYGLSRPTACWFAVLMVGWAWYRAALLSRRIPTFNDTAVRFDASLVLQFGVFFVSAWARITISGGMLWICALLLGNAAAMSLAQAGSQDERQPAWLGPLYLMVVLAPAYLLISLLFGQASAAGQAVYNAAVPVLNRLLGILEAVLLWFFASPPPVVVEGGGPVIGSGAENEAAAVAMPAWLIVVFKVCLWLFVGLAVLILLASVMYLLYLLWRRLWQRQEPVRVLPDRWQWLRWWYAFIHALARRLGAALRAVKPWLGAEMGHVETYHALLRWGKRKRRPRLSSETPYEYLRRLTAAFPEQSGDLTSITEYYVACSYGGRPEDPGHEKKLKAALRRLSLSVYKITAQEIGHGLGRVKTSMEKLWFRNKKPGKN